MEMKIIFALNSFLSKRLKALIGLTARFSLKNKLRH